MSWLLPAVAIPAGCLFLLVLGMCLWFRAGSGERNEQGNAPLVQKNPVAEPYSVWILQAELTCFIPFLAQMVLHQRQTLSN